MGTKVLFHQNPFTSSAKKGEKTESYETANVNISQSFCTLQHYPIPADGSKKLKQSKKI